MTDHTYIIDLHAAGSSRDEIIVDLVTTQGMSLNAATRAYQDTAKAEGWSARPESKKAAVLDALAELYAEQDWTYERMADALAELQGDPETLEPLAYGLSEGTARDYLKAYAQERGVPHPTRDPRAAIYEWFAEQGDEADKDAFMAYAVDGLGRSRSNANEYWKGYELHLYLVGRS